MDRLNKNIQRVSVGRASFLYSEFTPRKRSAKEMHVTDAVGACGMVRTAVCREA